MKLGLSTYAYPFSARNAAAGAGRWLHELLAITASLGCHCLQVGDNVNPDRLTVQELSGLKAAAEQKGIELQLGARGLTETRTMRSLETARLLGSPFLRVVIDDTGYEPSYPEVRSTIRHLMSALRSANIRLAIENHDRFSAKTLRSLIEDTDPEWIAICLDTANSLGNGEGVQEVLTALLPYVINLHIKDVRIRRVSSKMGFVVYGVPAGQGIIDIPLIVEMLDRTGRCPTAVLEMWHEPPPGAADPLPDERWAVEQSVNYLKPYFE